jgi:hypothetical protein
MIKKKKMEINREKEEKISYPPYGKKHAHEQASLG